MLRKWLFMVMLALSLVFPTGVFAAEKALPAEAGGQAAGGGEPAISREKARQIAGEIIPEIQGATDVQVLLENSPFGSGKFWRIDVNRSPSGVGTQPEYCSVMIDAKTGALINMNNSIGAGGAENTSVLSRDEARKKAEEFIRKYRPTEFARTRPSETDYYGFYQPETLQNTYGFTWERMEYGIPVEGDLISAAVDVLSGRVNSFHASWHETADFPGSGQTQSGMESRVLKDIGLVLCYQVVDARKDPSGVPQAALVYQLNAPGLKIDPTSGDALDMYGKRVSLKEYRLFSSLPVNGQVVNSTIESVPVSVPGRKSSREQAEQAAREFFKRLGFTGEVSNSGGGSVNDGLFVEESWSYSLRDEEEWKPGFRPRPQRYVNIDAFTGEVKSFNYFNPIDDEVENKEGSNKNAITMEEARTKALDFIRLVQPGKAGQIVERQEQDRFIKMPRSASRLYNFNFVRMVNGLPFLRDGIRVTVGADGSITNYNCDWHTVQFPDVKGVISREEAEKIFLEKFTLKPVYFFPWEEGKFRSAERPAMALTFNSPREQAIDAVTGKLVETNWQITRPVKSEPSATVPPEHWAANSLGLLAASGLLPAKGFDPDGPASRRDVVRVLMGAAGRHYGISPENGPAVPFKDINPSDRDYKPIQEAAQRDILEKTELFEPDRPTDRETVATWLVRALGYGDVAAMPVQIELKVADAGQVSEPSRNYVAIACGLGLMQGDENGQFHPSDNITWAELSSLVAKAMPLLRKGGW